MSFRAGHYKDLTETGNRARKVSGTQGTVLQNGRDNNSLEEQIVAFFKLQ